MQNTFVDTRGLAESPRTFSEAILEGIATGGGLFVPTSIPHLELDQILELASLPYAEQAARIYEAFGIDIPGSAIRSLMEGAYGAQWDDARIAPVTELSDGMHILELYHGPTAAFKDLALQCLPRFFEYAANQMRDEGKLHHDHLILVATSGDTGKAALEGFAHRGHIGIVVYYPDGGVSDVQLRQMTTQQGTNVGVFAARGDFDDCQTSVKRAFGDEAFCAKLMNDYGMALSSANSINWGRLMPQIVYYVGAYAQMVASGAIDAGNAIDVCVPTGNFGNILAAYYAKRMGTPIARLLCASNENDILTEFITTGTYDIRGRTLHLTPSPSMDILVSSNLERQLFELSGRDGRVAQWMQQLNSTGCFEVDEEVRARMQELYGASSVTNDECLEVIGQTYQQTGRLVDPHTAVAIEVARRLKEDRAVLVASTAHWAKFGPDVWRGLHGLSHSEPLPQKVAGLTGVELNRTIAEKTGASIHRALDALDGLPRRFTTVVDATQGGVEQSVWNWLERNS